MDQRPETYIKHTGEINTSEALYLIEQSITDTATSELCNIGIIILFIISYHGNFYCLLEFYLYRDFIDFTLKMATGNC